jgi:hypothetical protein
MSKRQKLNELKLKRRTRNHELANNTSSITHTETKITSNVKVTPNDVKVTPKVTNDDVKVTVVDDDIANLVKNEPVASTIVSKVSANSKRGRLQERKQKHRQQKRGIEIVISPIPLPEPSKIEMPKPTPSKLQLDETVQNVQTAQEQEKSESNEQSTPSEPPQKTTKRGTVSKKSKLADKAQSKRDHVRQNKEERVRIRREHAEQIHNDMFTKYGIKIDDIEIDKTIFERTCIAILNKFDQNKSYTKHELMSRLQYECDINSLKNTNDDTGNGIGTGLNREKELYLLVLQKIMKDIDESMLEEDTVVLKDTRISQDENFVKDNKKIDNKLFLMSVRLDIGYNPKEHPDETTNLLFSGRELYKKVKRPDEKDMKNGYIPDAVKASLVKTNFENELNDMFSQSLMTQTNTTKKVQLFSL